MSDLITLYLVITGVVALCAFCAAGAWALETTYEPESARAALIVLAWVPCALLWPLGVVVWIMWLKERSER